jgi:hypothetical protein
VCKESLKTSGKYAEKLNVTKKVLKIKETGDSNVARKMGTSVGKSDKVRSSDSICPKLK